MNDTWEIIVWDGAQWVRFPDIRFESPEDADATGARITCAPIAVLPSRDLDAGRLPLDTVKRKA